MTPIDVRHFRPDPEGKRKFLLHDRPADDGGAGGNPAAGGGGGGQSLTASSVINPTGPTPSSNPAEVALTYLP
jgi:hypothetical protein